MRSDRNDQPTVAFAGTKTTIENLLRAKGGEEPFPVFTLEDDNGWVLQGENLVPVFTKMHKARIYLFGREDVPVSSGNIKELTSSWFLRFEDSGRTIIINPESSTDSDGFCKFRIIS